MTSAERVQAVADYGFTERQARFLVLVMRRAGLCVKRQYATFAGVANGGEKCNTFFRKLIGRRFAVETAVYPQPGSALPRTPQVALPRDWRPRQPLSPPGIGTVGGGAADETRCRAGEPQPRVADHLIGQDCLPAWQHRKRG